MKNARIKPTDFYMKFILLLAGGVTFFVMLYPVQAWSSSSCDVVVSNNQPLVNMSLDQIWQKIVIENTASDGILIAKPERTRMLLLSRILANRIKEKLESFGYTSELVRFEARTDLNNFVPARWGVKIIQANATTWMGRVVNKAILNTEVEFFFDPYGLYRNGTEGSADYTGVTVVSFGINHIQKLNFNFIDSLLHEIHHGSNHKKLKAQDPSGIYAEVNSLVTSKEIPRHQFSIEYPYYFHFDELAAFSKEISQTRSQLRMTLPNSPEYLALKERLNYYSDSYQKLYSEALSIVEFATSTFLTESGQKGTVFFIDGLHQNATAQIWLKKPGEKENSFKFTIWTPGITKLNHDAKSYTAVYNEILALKMKILRLGPIEDDLTP